MITGPFYDASGAPYYYDTATQQRSSVGPVGTNLGTSPALGSPAQPAQFRPAPTTASAASPAATSGGIDLSQFFGAPGVAPKPLDLASLYTNATKPLMAETSGVTQAAMAQQKQEFDAQMAFAQQQLQQIGIPQVEIARLTQQLQQQAFNLQVGQVTGTYQGQPTEAVKEFQQNLALQIGQLVGQYGGVPTEAARQFNANLDLQRAQLGQQYLATAAQLQGPQNTFQLANYLRGAQGQPGVPLYLQSLANNVNLPAFQQTGTTPPTPQTAPGLMQQLGAGQLGTGSPAAGGGGGGGLPFGAVGVGPGGFQMAIPGATPTAAGGQGGAQTGPFLGGDFGKFLSGNPAQGTSVVYNPWSEHAPNDTRQGTLIPGTTGMYSGATQNFGYGPGQGSQSVTGTRGSNITGYDPNTGQLYVNYQFLTNKPRVVTGLFDVTNQQYVVDPSNAAGISGIQGQYDPKQGGWMAYPYLSGSNINTSYNVPKTAIDPSHEYTLQVSLPMEGGVGSDINDPSTHPRFTGAQILGLPNPNTQQAQQPGAAPAAAAPQQMQTPTFTYNPALAYGYGGFAGGWGGGGGGAGANLNLPTFYSTQNAAQANATPGWDYNQTLNTIGNIAQKGAQALGPGSLERMTSDELSAFGSGLGAAGYSLPTFLQNYAQSRIGQQAPVFKPTLA